MVTAMTAGTPQSADTLREQMVDDLLADGTIVSPSVERAFREVPRHLFAPDAELGHAYARDIVVVKRDEHGIPVSTVSAPEIQARMLEQAQIRPGMRVLEVGSGGYNAALCAELAGPSGQVTTVDIDPDVTGRASSFLGAAGYSRVRVVLADAEAGVLDGAPYDRIIVTAGAWDIPPAWTDQLAPDGMLVVPLRMRGITRSLALAGSADGSCLEARSAEVCGFVRMQGTGAHAERLWLLRGKQVGLRFDDGALEQPDMLDGVLGGEPGAAWSGVMVRKDEPFETLPLWLASVLPGFCVLAVDAGGDGPGIAVEPGGRWFPFAAVTGDSLAYLSTRPAGELVEFGAHGYGPHAAEAAAALAGQVTAWNRSYRDGPAPAIAAWPADTPDAAVQREGTRTAVIRKTHRLITISWPLD